jgi:hypothetical protein
VDQIVQMVKERAGIGEDQARTAVQTVVAELKKRLPDPIAAQIDGFLGGDRDAGDAQDPLGGLGGMLGR